MKTINTTKPKLDPNISMDKKWYFAEEQRTRGHTTLGLCNAIWQHHFGSGNNFKDSSDH